MKETLHEERPAPEHHRVEGSIRRTRMSISYTNRKGVTYTLYRGQTKTGKPRYYFGSMGQSQGEPVTELPVGFTISESVNGVVSLVKDRPSLIMPVEVAAVEAAMKQHPQAHRRRHSRVGAWRRVRDRDSWRRRLRTGRQRRRSLNFSEFVLG